MSSCPLSFSMLPDSKSLGISIGRTTFKTEGVVTLGGALSPSFKAIARKFSFGGVGDTLNDGGRVRKEVEDVVCFDRVRVATGESSVQRGSTRLITS